MITYPKVKNNDKILQEFLWNKVRNIKDTKRVPSSYNSRLENN